MHRLRYRSQHRSRGQTVIRSDGHDDGKSEKPLEW